MLIKHKKEPLVIGDDLNVVWEGFSCIMNARD